MGSLVALVIGVIIGMIITNATTGNAKATNKNIESSQNIKDDGTLICYCDENYSCWGFKQPIGRPSCDCCSRHASGNS